ncbi:hypothetical protein [Spirosoma oryzicola]|uniref:hypothetical protein n=1 Tax=Spirosoma oryzicola TaxID=2898794 RepID=UPI001E489517|nr:hypothetical protein [Spirosoma oryzicola]UHG91773.1 hypothetical protein LQ777_02475 [Spirosoma oryzicola]
MTFFAWSVHTVLSIGLLAAIAQGCVKVEQKPQAVEQVDSLKLTLAVDSTAIYRCDTCAFAVAYRKQSSGQVKPCKTCNWVSLSKPAHNKGDVPEPTNQPVNPLAEQDAIQHNTVHLVTPDKAPTDSGDTPEPSKPPIAEAVANRRVKPGNLPETPQ